MKKRILSILLTLCMTLCLTPISVFAEEVGTEGSAAIQLGADALSVLSKNVNTATAPTVYFGQNHENNPAAWRVIGYDGSGVTSSKGDITLLAAGAMGVIPFVDAILNNEYAPSNLKATIDALAEKLTTEENAAVKKRALTSGSYDGENTDCVAGAQVDNAVFWPLSAKEAIAVNNDLRALDPAHPNWVTTGWWLRSPGSDKYHLAVVRSEGSVQYSGYSVLIFNNYRTVRPAFNLNMNSVLFASAAVGGKPDGGLTEVSKYSGNEWKLTLLDSRRNFAVTEKTVSAAPDDTVTLNYKGATTGKNEYISVILADNNGAQYYGRVAQPTTESGTVEIKIPSDIAPGDYTMKVFSEQYNGDCKTDLASAFADVTLTVESQPDEQFTLAPGGRYYFDLSAMNIPGTVNSNLPDSTLHYVPFTYVGTVNAYRLTSETATTEEYAQKNKYPHSLFIADYAVTHTVSWDALNTADLIFGKNYASGGVDYTLRAPSVGSSYTGSGDSERGTPKSNEWDKILDKDDGYIKNWREMLSCGQDTTIRISASFRAVRGWKRSARFWTSYNTSYSTFGFRPVLEVLNPDTLGSDGLKVVTLDLGGGTLGNSSEDIQIIVKNGSTFTAPASDGLTRPDGDTDNYFMWLDGNGNSYEPGGSVPSDVTELTVQWTAPTYAVTLNTNGGTINNGNVTGYTYGVGATLPAADDMTYTGHTFKGWYDNENLTGSPVTAIGGAETGNKEYWAKWEINQYTVTVKPENGKADIIITQDYGTPITAPTLTREGYTFKGWDKEIPETMPAENITITARWKDTEKPTGEIIIGTNKWNEFLNELTFGIFFKDTQEVTINAVDNSGVVFVSYLVTDKELSEAELNSLVFRAYEEPFCIDPNGEYIIYVMLVDENINITYLRSDRITLDNIQPVISGIENGKTYCEAQTVTVDEKYVDTVTVNGTVVTLDADGGFVLPPTNGEQRIVVTDKSGNNAEMTVTVNNGHTFGEWVSDNDGKHTRKCTVDGCDAFETENCSGGNATCTEKAICDVCGKAYGEFDGTNHKGGVQEWTTRTAFNHEQKWNCCGAVIVASEAHEWKDGVCRECGYVCLHNDTDKDHICDYCKKTISEHVDKDKNHICDYCEKTISAHEDAPTEKIKKADTVTAKLPDNSKSPQTGDNSNLILWIALLIISGGVMKGVTAFGKSKKHSAKIKDK
nr:InlB B-repeat-containing protein [Ruminococcus bromii]